MLLPILAAAALAVTPSLESGLVFWDDYTAPRSATVSAAGAKVVRIHARAGWLKVRGRDGAANVKATGTARASNESWLPEIKLTAERSGDVIDVTVDIPERSFVGEEAWTIIRRLRPTPRRSRRRGISSMYRSRPR